MRSRLMFTPRKRVTSEAGPNVRMFKLREGVTFHDSAAFDGADAKFSLERAMSADSGHDALLPSVSEISTSDAYAVEIMTDGPNPIMPNNLFIMDKDWRSEQCHQGAGCRGLRRYIVGQKR